MDGYEILHTYKIYPDNDTEYEIVKTDEGDVIDVKCVAKTANNVVHHADIAMVIKEITEMKEFDAVAVDNVVDVAPSNLKIVNKEG